jgi:hypothetical protein
VAKKKRSNRQAPARRTKQSAAKSGPTPTAEKQAKVAELGMRVDPEEAVDQINHMVDSNIDAIGDYLIEQFFAGSVENIRPDGRNSAGFVRLQQYNEQLQLSYSWLRMILNVKKQRHELEQAGYGEPLSYLSFSHEAKLVSVEWPQKVKLLKQVANKGWSVRQLEVAVSDRQEEKAPPKLTPKRIGARVDRVEKTLSQAIDPKLVRAAAKLPAKERRSLRSRVDKQLKTLQKLRDSLDRE